MLSAHQGLLGDMAVLILVLSDAPQILCVLPGSYHVRKSAGKKMNSACFHEANSSMRSMSCMAFMATEDSMRFLLHVAIL